MEQKGKFVLMILDEFGPFLDAAVVHRAIHLVQNHHTFIPNYSHFTGANHFKLLEGMERAHLERGFAEIAQNLTIFPDGRVAVCRSLDKIPAGIKGANGGGICIENVGDFDTGKDQMTDEQRDTIVAVNAMLCRRFSLTPDADSIVYHHWFDLDSGQRTNGTGITKSCPGTGFFGGNRVPDAVGGLIPRIVAVMSGAAPPPPPPLFLAHVTADSLNVRLGPGVQHAVVNRLTKGTPVRVFEESGNWARIDPANPHWANSRFLEKD